MKRLVLGLILIIFTISYTHAQKYAYVDTEYILDNIPEYKDAQNQLDELAKQYQQEIEAEFVKIDKMLRDFQAEAILMPDDIKKKKEEEITERENEVRELQNQRFGRDGDLFLKREELIKPIQEKIYNTIEEIATEKNYAFVFDRAGSLSILFANPKYDISDDVLDEVGTVLGTVRKEDRVKNEYKSGKSGSNMPDNPGGGSSPVNRK